MSFDLPPKPVPAQEVFPQTAFSQCATKEMLLARFANFGNGWAGINFDAAELTLDQIENALSQDDRDKAETLIMTIPPTAGLRSAVGKVFGVTEKSKVGRILPENYFNNGVSTHPRLPADGGSRIEKVKASIAVVVTQVNELGDVYSKGNNEMVSVDIIRRGIDIAIAQATDLTNDGLFYENHSFLMIPSNGGLRPLLKKLLLQWRELLKEQSK